MLSGAEQTEQQDIVILPANEIGEDLIVGDVHGEIDCFRQLVDTMKPEDRLFIAGDLVDKGQNSLAVLELIWSKKNIYAVCGNHEDLCYRAISDLEKIAPRILNATFDLDAYLDAEDTKYPHLKNCMKNGGAWFINLFIQELKEKKIEIKVTEWSQKKSSRALKWEVHYDSDKSVMARVLTYFETLPYIIIVNARNANADRSYVPPFLVVHADPPCSDDELIARYNKGQEFTVAEIEYMTWARFNGVHEILLRPNGRNIDSMLAYCGHNINVFSPDMTVCEDTNRLTMDCGAFLFGELKAVLHHARKIITFYSSTNQTYIQNEHVSNSIQQAIENHLQKHYSLALYRAAEVGDSEKVANLLKQGFSPLTNHPQAAVTPIFISTLNKHDVIAESLMAACSQDELQKKEAHAQHASAMVHRCVGSSQFDIDELEKYCSVEGVNLDSFNPLTKFTPLRLAVFIKNLAAVNLLLEKGADPNLGNPLAMVCSLGRIAYVRELLSNKRIDVNQRNSEGKTPLYMAIEDYLDSGRKSRELIKLLLEKADPNLPNTDGQTPLFLATERGSERLKELLLAHGADKKAVPVILRPSAAPSPKLFLSPRGFGGNFWSQPADTKTPAAAAKPSTGFTP